MPNPDAGARYASLLGQGAELHPDIRVGRPGRSRAYWAVIALMRVLRVRYRVRMHGADQIAAGPTILVGNHVHWVDPGVVVIARWWRVSAFTKVEAFQSRGAFFFRLMGQIPLRRGDAEATQWAMEMAQEALAYGGKLGLYPEGTRSPDPNRLHKLHKRILVPLLQGNPDVPVHVVTTRYHPPRRGRVPVEVQVSPPLDLDAAHASADELVVRVRDQILALSGQTYRDRYAQDVKAERRAAGGSQR